jgi:hypothetical protein
MRPRESEGKAEGLDEDDEGVVRSERSGPQWRALAAPPPAPPGDLRRDSPHAKTPPYKANRIESTKKLKSSQIDAD